MLAPNSFIRARESTIEVSGCADQREMRECLGEVAEMTPIATQFFRVEPKMVGVAQELFKHQLCLFQFAGARQAFDIPERTSRKAAFGTGQSVYMASLCLVAVHQGV